MKNHAKILFEKSTEMVVRMLDFNKANNMASEILSSENHVS